MEGLAIYCNEVDGKTIVLLLIKNPKKSFTYTVSQCDNTSAYATPFNLSEFTEWVLYYQNIWDEVEFFGKLITGCIKGEYKNIYGKLKTRKECPKTNFNSHCQRLTHYTNKVKTVILRYTLKSALMQKVRNVTC